MKVLIGTILIIFLIGIWCAISISSEADEQVKRMLLRREAMDKYPNLPMSVALSNLYNETFKSIKKERQAKNDTEELEEKLILIYNERNLALQEELDEESSVRRPS
ncbi:MAG TPA: hypothetical protein PK595_06820 [Bacteroidota bacterium]|nr:hypothetical protein [Bacteroidota bacterium]